MKFKNHQLNTLKIEQRSLNKSKSKFKRKKLKQSQSMKSKRKILLNQ
jgi:hypothetical protein